MIPAQPQADALEQRDTWRSVWAVLTSDALAASLVAALLFLGAASTALPQAPAAGTADPVAYSQWQAQAQAQAGAAYQAVQALGLFDVARALWVRGLIWVLAAVLLARLADRAFRLAAARRLGGAIQDEQRLRVAERAPGLDRVAADLKARRYRVTCSPGEVQWVRADRAPWAEALSIALHAGALVVLGGVLLNLDQGWQVSRLQVNSDAPVALVAGGPAVALQAADRAKGEAVFSLAGATSPLTLSVGSSARAAAPAGESASCCLELKLAGLTTEYLVRADSATGAPVTLTLSSYASPTTEALLTFRPGETERSLAVEPAGMALLVAARNSGDRVQAYAIPSGRLLTDTLVQPSLTISATTLQFAPRSGAIVSASYTPGDPLVWLGAAVAAAGLLGALLYPMQVIIVRWRGAWMEFYASGRRVRPVVRELSARASAPHDGQAALHGS